ncbi:MAG: hypothetical protein IKF91_00685 [Bacilli bacterium]|nr:hypothetical protein [Bacilli bacterium]
MKKVILIFFIILFFIIYTVIDLDKNKIDFHEVKINIEENESNKASVSNIGEFIGALEDDNIKVIEILNDIDLGYNLVKKEGIKSSYIECHNKPLTHPILKETGVSKLNIKNKDGLIIYSKGGYKLLHTNIRIINSKNIKLENLKMEELWEWDEDTKGEYDRNDWDYITILNSKNVLISHMEFSKSYDGITDIKNSENVTIEYSRLNKMDINNDFFNRQFTYLEENIDMYPMYKFLRKDAGLSIKKIKELSLYQFKLYLIGPKDNGNENKNIVIHDGMYLNAKTRIPFARNSSVYLYNIYFDASSIKRSIVSNKERNKIRKKYLRLICLDPYGPISIQRSYVKVNNSIFKGVRNRYTWYRGFSYKNLGKIVVKNDKKILKNLKKKLEKEAGVYEK